MRRKEGAFITALVLIVAMVLILVTLPLEPLRGMNPPSSTEIVSDRFARHLLLLESGNASAIVNDYERNANVVWTGDAQGLQGDYSGSNNIGLLLRVFEQFGPPSIENETHTTMANGNDLVTVNSVFGFIGNSNIYGKVNGTVSAQVSYAYSTVVGRWLISRETWDFIRFNVQLRSITGGPGPGPSSTQAVDFASVSADGSYAALGTTDVGGKNGSVYLVSLQTPWQHELWRHVTNNTAIDSVAISANGSYVAAGGYWSGMFYGGGEVYLLNQAGRLLWTVSTGAESPVFQVAISSNGSRIAADYEHGILYLDDAGHIFWNYTFGAQGPSSHFAMSSDGGFVVSAVGNELIYLNSQGHQVWNYKADSDVNFVQMSSDGSYVAAGSLGGGNNHGSVYYLDGKDGSLLWRHQAYTPVQPLVMSADGSHVASGGNVGVLLFDSSGALLWNYTNVSGEPAAISQSKSLVLLYGEYTHQVQLIGYNGTIVATLDIANLSAVAASPRSLEWVAVGGVDLSEGWMRGHSYLRRLDHAYNGHAMLDIPSK